MESGACSADVDNRGGVRVVGMGHGLKQDTIDSSTEFSNTKPKITTPCNHCTRTSKASLTNLPSNCGISVATPVVP